MKFFFTRTGNGQWRKWTTKESENGSFLGRFVCLKTVDVQTRNDHQVNGSERDSSFFCKLVLIDQANGFWSDIHDDHRR